MKRFVPWVAVLVFAFPVLASADCALCLLGVCPTMTSAAAATAHHETTTKIDCCGTDEVVSADSSGGSMVSGAAHNCSCLKAPGDSTSWFAQAKTAPLKSFFPATSAFDRAFSSRTIIVINAAHSRAPPHYTFLDLSSLRI